MARSCVLSENAIKVNGSMEGWKMGRGMKVWAAGMVVVALGGISVLGAGFAGAADEPMVRVADPEVGKSLEPVAKVEREEPERAARKEQAQKKPRKVEKKLDKAERKKVKDRVVERTDRREAGRKAEPKARVIFRPTVPVNKTLSLTIPKMGLSGTPVYNTTDPEVLDRGAIKLPQSGFPWRDGSNTYIAAHVLGYPGTGSFKLFANLPNMERGDEITLQDALGRTYTYRVYKTMVVTPYDLWVIKPTPGKTTVTLQTCLNPPAYDQRLIVRGELVE